MPEQHDELRPILRTLRVPDPSADAVPRIQEAARDNPRRLWRWIAALRQLRALIYIPAMRYAVMAVMVAFFVIIGMLSSPPSTPKQITEEALLIDVDFAEERWAEQFFADGSG